ncbi:MAG: hypothetical protein M9902_01660 [Thermomonas sp.]|nr:hypothetical protein [Thermomonas sp.]
MPSTASRTLSQGVGGPVEFAAQYSASGFDSRPQAIHGLLKPDQTTHTLRVFRIPWIDIVVSGLPANPIHKAPFTGAEKPATRTKILRPPACAIDSSGPGMARGRESKPDAQLERRSERAGRRPALTPENIDPRGCRIRMSCAVAAVAIDREPNTLAGRG